MKHKLTLAFASAALITACSSTPPAAPVASCVYPDGSNIEAPTWVCNAPIEEAELSAVGFADKSAAGLNFMKQMAATAARVELAQTMKVELENMIKQYAETTGSGDSETVDMVNTSVTKQITKETLVGSRIFRQITMPQGGMAVAVGLDAETVGKIQEQAIKTSMNNDKALWQKFQADKAFDEMAADIAKLKQ